MSQGVSPITPDISALIQMQEQAKKSATFNMVILVVLIIAFLAGGYTVYKNLTAPPAIKSSVGPTTKTSDSIQGPESITCDEAGTQLVQYDGKYMCGPICKGNQKLAMTGPTGATYLTCVCPSTGFIPSDYCGGCIPEKCATGYHICPAKGICSCTLSASGTCKTYIDDVDGTILAGSKTEDPDCPATCVDTVEYLKTVNANKILSSLNEVCKQSDCFYDRQNPESMVECSRTGAKFDGFNLELGTCYKKMDCTARPDQKAISMYGTNTISNLPSECLTMKTTPDGFCLPLNTEDIKKKCINDSDGCPVGYYLLTGTNACVAATGSNLPSPIAAGTPGCRTPGSTRYWDGVSCLGSVAYDLLLNVYQCQTTWAILSTGKINSFTQFGAYIAVPSARVRGVERFVFQIAGFECSMTTANKSIIVNGNKSSMTLNPLSASRTVEFAKFADKQLNLNRNDYEFYNVQGIFGTSRSQSLFPSQDRNTWNVGSAPQIPYRFTVGLLIQGADGKYVLNSLTEESKRSSNESDLIGTLQNVSMSQFVMRTPGGLPTPPTLNGEVARRVFLDNTASVAGTNKILSLTVASANTESNLSVSAPIQNPITFVSQGEDQPYCIAGCLPDYCPGILDVTSPDNIKVVNQLILFAINIDLANTAFPLNTNGTTKTVAEKEDSSYIYVMRTPLTTSSTRPWSTLINQPGFFIVDNMNEKYKLSSIVSTGSGTDKHYILSDYIEAGKNYRYDIGYYWGNSNYKTSLDEGKASSLRTFMVFAPPYTRDSCWAIPYNGNENLPPHMILGPGNACVYPGFVNTTIGYGSNAPYEFKANIYSPTGPNKFSNFRPKDVKLWAGSNYYSMTGVPNNIKISDVDIKEANSRILNPTGADSYKVWDATSPNWFSGIGGTVKVEVEDGIVSARDYNVGYSAEEYKGRLRDMDAFGRRNIPGYVPLSTDVHYYARGPTGILANPGFFDFETGQFSNNGAGKAVFAQGYRPVTDTDADINQKVSSLLKATDVSKFPNSTYYNYVSPVRETVEQEGRKKVFSADFRYITTPSTQRPVDITPDTMINIRDLAYNQATGCIGKPLLICNRGSQGMYGKCSCEPTSATQPGRCDTTKTESLKNLQITI